MKNPPHPGVILKEEFINALQLTVTGVAKKLRVNRSVLSNIINEKAGISAEMSLKLAKLFNLDEDFFYNLQMIYDLAQAKKNADLSLIEPIQDIA